MGVTRTKIPVYRPLKKFCRFIFLWNLLRGCFLTNLNFCVIEKFCPRKFLFRQVSWKGIRDEQAHQTGQVVSRHWAPLQRSKSGKIPIFLWSLKRLFFLTWKDTKVKLLGFFVNFALLLSSASLFFMHLADRTV